MLVSKIRLDFFVTPMNKKSTIMFVQLGEVTIDAVVDCTPLSMHVRYIYLQLHKDQPFM